MPKNIYLLFFDNNIVFRANFLQFNFVLGYNYLKRLPGKWNAPWHASQRDYQRARPSLNWRVPEFLHFLLFFCILFLFLFFFTIFFCFCFFVSIIFTDHTRCLKTHDNWWMWAENIFMLKKNFLLKKRKENKEKYINHEF